MSGTVRVDLRCATDASVLRRSVREARADPAVTEVPRRNRIFWLAIPAA
jgi:hypothetical protein